MTGLRLKSPPSSAGTNTTIEIAPSVAPEHKPLTPDPSVKRSGLVTQIEPAGISARATPIPWLELTAIGGLIIACILNAISLLVGLG